MNEDKILMALGSMDNKLETLDGNVNDIKSVVLGNGKPHGSLVHKVAKLEDSVKPIVEIEKRVRVLENGEKVKKTKAQITIEVVKAVGLILISILALIGNMKKG